MPEQIFRRVAGWHDNRMDGLTDLILRAPGKSVMDIGCNRGLVGFEFFANGATMVHGCDNYAEGIQTARHLFADMRNCESKFEVVDLSHGPASLAPFGSQKYDIVVMLATYHKLKRVMTAETLQALMRDFLGRTITYFAWRGTSDKHDENLQEMAAIDELSRGALKRIHTSIISRELGIAAIWERADRESL